MSNLEEENISLYPSSPENEGMKQKAEASRAKIEFGSEDLEEEKEDDQTVPNLIMKKDAIGQIEKVSPSKLREKIEINPNPFVLVPQDDEESDNEDFENSDIFFYPDSSDCSDVEIEYFEKTVTWFVFEDSPNEE